MKLFKDRQFMVRAFAVVAEAILFYAFYLFFNRFVEGAKINLAFFIIIALCGLFLNNMPYNDSDKHKHRIVFGSTGIVLAVAAIVITALTTGMNLFGIPVGFIALVLLYSRSYILYLVNISYVYTAGNFYRNMLLLFVVNGAVAFWTRNYASIAGELTRLTILYIIFGLYNLSEVKNYRYANKEESIKRTAFDITATSLMMVFSVVMSIPTVFNIVLHPFAVVFTVIYNWVMKGALIIIYNIGKVFEYVFTAIGNLKFRTHRIEPIEEVGEMAKQNMDNFFYLDTPAAKLIGKILALVIMLLICACVAYLLYRLFDKIRNQDKEEDFSEEREFIFLSRKQKGPGIVNKVTNTMKKAAEGISFMLTADNKDKLRSEYKGFVQKLYNKKIITEHNNTAQEILQLMLSKAPEQMKPLAEITGLYEAVRYGTKYPEDSELKSFRQNITQVSRYLQQMQ